MPYGQSWFDVPFLWAESYFYRRLLEAVGYYGRGPWAGVDPFEPAKSAELAHVDQLVCPTDRQELLAGCLWGNQADLGFRAGLAAATPGPGQARTHHDGHRSADPSRTGPGSGDDRRHRHAGTRSATTALVAASAPDAPKSSAASRPSAGPTPVPP